MPKVSYVSKWNYNVF